MFQSIAVVKASGFSVELIHPDSPLSPFYNASLSSSEILMKNAINSMDRLKHLQSLIDQKCVQSAVIPIQGCHLMKFFIGTPPVEYLAVLDTGSDLAWIQCVPCTKCFSQDYSFFDPNASSTYKMLSHGSQTCQEIGGQQYLETNDCQYHITYGDGSTSIGILSSDTLSFDPTFGQKSTFPKFIFGCGRNNQFADQNPEVAGIFGLGGGSSSLVYQIRNQIHHRFSYCLVPHTSNATGKLFLGRKSIVDRPGVVSTPLVSKIPDTYYYVTLEGVSIGDKTVRSSLGKGNVFIDSGVTFPLLEPDLYDGLEAMVKDAIGEEPVKDPSGLFKLCYEADANINVPEIVFRFTGADVRLKPVNTFEVHGDLVCMVILSSGYPQSIFGNYAQVNFLLEYDLDKRTVSFLPTDCTRHY
ncbi:hypothetical protein like AT1G64830 [Hibiscus trionum]|uniref:Peptidase A1 domain-containing protein n=1 Tax=Hibiscus trionum TaxID=183268 RepID=A0A9W7H8X8_HIBTR|nr:hypothetical protein like AT1G64830 [Hibiscus trionum]